MAFREPKKKRKIGGATVTLMAEHEAGVRAIADQFQGFGRLPGASRTGDLRSDLAKVLYSLLDHRGSIQTAGQCQFMDGVLADARILQNRYGSFGTDRAKLSVGMEMVRGVFERYTSDYAFCRLVCVIAAAMNTGAERFGHADIVNATMIALLRRSARLSCGLNPPKGARR